MTAPHTVIIGAGPAGLTAAYELTKRNATVEVFEADDVVGGISRTVERDGWRFDIGGHRFFTKVPQVEALWHEILSDEDFLLRPRMSRIYYRGRLYDYPLKAGNALRNLGIFEALRCVGSYLWAKVSPPKDQSHLAGWVTARFGRRLFTHFFKTYNEKLWGVPATELSADWAAQRIKNLSLSNAVLNALMPKRNQKDITSLIEEFNYPKYGPGMMWERCAEHVEKRGGVVTLNSGVSAVHRADGRAVAVTVTSPTGERRVPADHVVSSMPISQLVLAMEPPAPADVVTAARDLFYRDFLTVALVVPEEFSFPDNWIYIHAPEVKVGRIQNFGSWSPYLVKDGRTCLGLEYFLNFGDELWNSPDADLVALGTAELERLGLVRPGCVESGYVVRMPRAYPFYDFAYKDNVATIRAWLEAEVPNVHPVGRNGMHRYNNADHSMMTALLSVSNILDGTDHDVWEVNVEEEYHEEKTPGEHGTGRAAPVLPRDRVPG
ncbi:NAD(P)/FAD-dependent oxidoreductase [Plantactinospora soyae]|uniref:Protoporphyrinogen oxidase n=1 Tax=Plantactinospora soyae TaxID=1544732 RepID=A0A927MJ57_9ACTN|nr:NAD(P)/FAD-dependent oxidoreductase [Plantactinospora soyae]MBE1492548.1 protoporphyrinogen oxidase [Plantactinospora soyae]